MSGKEFATMNPECFFPDDLTEDWKKISPLTVCYRINWYLSVCPFTSGCLVLVARLGWLGRWRNFVHSSSL